jgi:hypothetical protein
MVTGITPVMTTHISATTISQRDKLSLLFFHGSQCCKMLSFL